MKMFQKYHIFSRFRENQDIWYPEPKFMGNETELFKTHKSGLSQEYWAKWDQYLLHTFRHTFTTKNVKADGTYSTLICPIITNTCNCGETWVIYM
jgi:hypothetical protein